MLFVRSGERTVPELIEDGYKYVTWDLETIDDFDRDLEDEPVISYSLTFAKTIDTVPERMPTVVRTVEDTREEEQLLRELKNTLEPLISTVTLIGHNAAHWLPTLSTNGYDARKLLERSSDYGIDASFIRGMQSYDTMDVAASLFRHDDHTKSHRWLKLDELKRWYGIKQPTKFEGLGSDVRALFQREEYERILLYNVADTMAETAVASVLYHQQHTCRPQDGQFSHNDTCEHRRDNYDLEALHDWQRIKYQTSFSDGPV